ncbi:MAG: hypothetical protein JNL83_04780 [Myxococcales bacterium]|nr:hypothetical protein [Myxococcales bacterium]
MASWWSITVPPEFQDVTAQAMTDPAFQASLDEIGKSAGTVDAQFWSSETSVILALDSRFGDMPNSLAVLEGFENGARTSTYGSGKEHSYRVDKDGYFLISHQHATNSAGEAMWTQRWTGRGTDGALHSLGVACTGDELGCKGVLAKVKVDPKSFVLQSDIPATTKSGRDVAYTIGYAVGGAMVLAFVLYARAKARQRSRAA